MMLNDFCVFLYPNTPNLTKDEFLDLSVYLFFKENEINFNIPNFCPPVYISDGLWMYLFTGIADSIHNIHAYVGGQCTNGGQGICISLLCEYHYVPFDGATSRNNNHVTSKYIPLDINM